MCGMIYKSKAKLGDRKRVIWNAIQYLLKKRPDKFELIREDNYTIIITEFTGECVLNQYRVRGKVLGRFNFATTCISLDEKIIGLKTE